MKTLSVIVLLLIAAFSFGQTEPFTIEAYKQFLQSHQDMTTGEVFALHPAGTFLSKTPVVSTNPLYLDSITLKYNLTSDEQTLIREHGFMVTESRACSTFAQAYLDIWHKDLPVFVTTDALLHALHASYDAILKQVEISVLIPKLDSLLEELHVQVQTLDSVYGGNASMEQKLKDVDVYLTIAKSLLRGNAQPYYSDNSAELSTVLDLIRDENVVDYPLFASEERTIDFSQFKVRGHYTDASYPELARYFKAMMWLGRTEIYLIPPETLGPKPTPEDVQRQIIDAALLVEAAARANAFPLYAQIDSIIQFFVGESDNVTLPNMQQLLSAVAIPSADELLDTNLVKEFQDTLITKSYAFQRILSQILFNDPMNPDSIRPASAFMLFGQRFIIDSYITGQVVYDKIVYQGTRITRLLPSTLDVLFALGNDAAAQLLQSELVTYHYGSNLSAARYLVDAYDSTFWQSSLFNLWLNCIRAMNPPPVRDSLPAFMQTAAWWQEKMNTQLSSWTELRHDNLLYAKQSYTGGIECSYPYGYVEPVPAFYEAVKMFARIAEQYFQQMPFTSSYFKSRVVNYFRELKTTAGMLGTIAEKEIHGVALSEDEGKFLKKMLYLAGVCGPEYTGWYYKLYYTGDESFFKKDYLVADIHTTPTDEFGNMVGWVKHAGTGPINLGVFVARHPSGQDIAYVGATMSYREFMTENFLRLSDEEWKNTYLFSSTRPSFVNLYLADSNGNVKGSGTNLFMSPAGVKPPASLPETFTLEQNYPNPFNAGTLIGFKIPLAAKVNDVELAIYSMNGQLIRTLFKNTVPGGTYVFRWDGKDNNTKEVATGAYIYELRVGERVEAKKMMLMK
ncbi:MAG: DUF3160 domain-containing protein [Bacteroidetes bacterium]|nr:MAG: DUF3160 domain-containing protein [Bacteroidota bacterium]